MKRLLAKNIKRDLPYYFIIICAFLIPLHKIITPWFIGIWAFTAIFTYNWKKLIIAFIKNKTAWIFPLIYILCIIALFFTDNIEHGLFKLEVKLSYIIFPLVMLPAIEFNIQKRFAVMLSFVAGNLIAVIICIIVAISNYSELGISSFYYYNLSVFHHTSYAAMYLAFAISILYMCYLRQKVFPIAKWSFFPIFFLFLIFIYFLSSKSGLLSMVALIILFLGMSVKQSFSWANLIFSLIIIGATIFLVLQNERFTSTAKVVTTEINPATTESTSSRILVWNTSLELIKENILFGTSPGDADDTLIKSYHEKGYMGAEEKRLNTHNQYLQTLLSLGLPGILLLISAFLIPLLVHGKSNFILIIFLGITGFNFLFESALETQSGVIFFMFFFTLLNYTNKYNENDTLLSSSH
jgi:O-antigen ligase